MKLNLQLLTLAALIMLAFISGVHAQNTCGSAEWFDDYQFDGQYMTANFSTVGVPNDNATSGAPFCGTSVGTGGQKWFRFSLNSPEPIMVTLSTDHFITNFDTKIHVFVGFCGYLACIAGDDDSGTGTTSTVTFEALPGQVYRVRVGGYNGAEGTTNVQMFAGSPGCTDPAAQNYHWSYTWDNGSCCYNGYATLHITNNGGQPFENTASILVDNQNYLEIHPNYTMSACTPQSCNFQLEFYDSNGGSWGGDTYTLEINGRSFTGPIPSPDPWGYSTVDIPVCGCTDPMAGNYSYQAIYDDGSCCYNGTLSLSADAPASAEAYFYGVDAWWPLAIANPGQTVNFCSTKICGTRVVIAASTGTTPSGSYTLTLNGQTFTGAMTSIYDVFHLDFPACGCTDPAAINYEASATIDDNGCYYDANAFCEGAKLMLPYTAMILDYTDVPYAIGLPEGCDFIAGNSRVLWYKFVYTGGTFRISTSGLQDTQLAIFDECGGNMITCLDDIFFSNDQGNSIFSLNPFATFDCDSGLISGHTYYVCAATYDAGNNPSYLMFEPVEFPGCTDPTAMNYHPCASNEDGSCVYADACPADLDNNGIVNVADMLLFMAEFGSNCNSSENAE